MTIREANIKIKQIDNDIEAYETKKALEFAKTQPGAVKTDKEVVDGIQVVDKNINYVIQAEKIDRTLCLLAEEKERLEQWVERELKIIGEYDPLKAKIIKLREETKLTWDKISEATGYSRRQCINIYKNFTEQRLSEIEEATNYLKNN